MQAAEKRRQWNAPQPAADRAVLPARYDPPAGGERAETAQLEGEKPSADEEGQSLIS